VTPMIRFLVCCCVGLVILLPSSSAPCRGEDFTLKAEPIEALEGGPAIIKLTLEYNGKAAVVVPNLCVDRAEDYIEVSDPKGWARPLNKKYELSSASVIVYDRDFKPGEKVIKHVFVHHLFSTMPSGRVRLEFGWSIPAQDKLTELAHPKATCDLEVLSANERNLKAVRGRIAEDLIQDDSEITEEKLLFLANQLMWTEHPDVFVPLCFRYLVLHSSSRRPDYLWYTVAYYLTRCEKKSPALREKMIDYLVEHGSGKPAGVLFGRWRVDRADLTREQVARLLKARDLQVRVYTLRTFPDKCPEGARQKVLDSLGELKRSVEK
jgi:hypothetical protein